MYIKNEGKNKFWFIPLEAKYFYKIYVQIIYFTNLILKNKLFILLIIKYLYRKYYYFKSILRNSKSNDSKKVIAENLNKSRQIGRAHV